uniref:Head to tail adaptor n=1 Tax=Siphoviridae sp. ct3CA7 TaxID=2823561 RepID=A0A8S5LF88_9CAUD|nr:MAG TPA: head to tail adaptor [Siphoviridae sp. ct3CA7]
MLDPEEHQRLELFLQDAEDYIRNEFLKRGRDFDAELVSVPWLRFSATRVIREMVAAAIMVGGNTGVRTLTSTTGPQSDSITFAQVGVSGYGGVTLTDEWRIELGLGSGGPRGRFPDPQPWPEEPARRGWGIGVDSGYPARVVRPGRKPY